MIVRDIKQGGYYFYEGNKVESWSGNVECEGKQKIKNWRIAFIMQDGKILRVSVFHRLNGGGFSIPKEYIKGEDETGYIKQTN